MIRYIRLLFTFIKLCITNTGELSKALFNVTRELVAKNKVIQTYRLPQGLKTIDLLELFPDFEEKISSYSFLEGTSLISDIALLKKLALRYDNCQYIEFGSWRGESIANISQVTNNTTSLSFSNAEMRAIGLPAEVINTSRVFLKNAKNINFIEHNTQTYDFTKLEKQFDLIFVDADHEYEGVKIDTQNAFKLLKNENSIIVWHDYGKSTENINWPVFAGIMDGAPSDEHRKKIYRISNTLCAIYINGSFNASYPTKYFPNKTFEVTVKAARFNA
ncbi:MAG: class I SAM-dependent methyltransferase [Bacteroidetes bacterium]|nr:class I SAM-dependent methyltransferase [Bacteroidota bacterium]